MAHGWLAEETSDGTYDLTLKGRAVSYGLENLEAAKRVVRRTDGKGTKLEVIEASDGFRTTVTV